jgi:hypothetical protein
MPDVYEVKSNIGICIMLGILFQIIQFFSKAQNMDIHACMYIPWLLFISLCIHAFLEGFPVSHHQDLAVGIAIHHLPIAIILTTFFINSHLHKSYFGFIHLCINDSIGTLASDFLPILNDYYTEITALSSGYYFIFPLYHFESSEGHKFNIAKVSMIVLGIALAYFL